MNSEMLEKSIALREKVKQKEYEITGLEKNLEDALKGTEFVVHIKIPYIWTEPDPGGGWSSIQHESYHERKFEVDKELITKQTQKVLKLLKEELEVLKEEFDNL